MIIIDEKDAPFSIANPPESRVLKCLLSPQLNPEVKGISVGITILPTSSRSDYISHVEAELFYVISGSGKIKVENRIVDLSPGIAVWVTPYETHQLINDSENVLKILWVLAPSGREAKILEDYNMKTIT